MTKGAFNYMREDYGCVSDEINPKKYFSGGVIGEIEIKQTEVNIPNLDNRLLRKCLMVLTVLTTSILISNSKSVFAVSTEFLVKTQTTQSQMDESNLKYSKDLMRSSRYGDVLGVRALLNLGVNVNMKDSDGWTALIIASLFGQLEIVKVLLENGADVNMKGLHGMTALMLATKAGHLEAVKVLLDKEADVSIKANDGQTALSIAKELGNNEVAKLLINSSVGTKETNEFINTDSLTTNEGGTKKTTIQKNADGKGTSNLKIEHIINDIENANPYISIKAVSHLYKLELPPEETVPALFLMLKKRDLWLIDKDFSKRIWLIIRSEILYLKEIGTDIEIIVALEQILKWQKNNPDLVLTYSMLNEIVEDMTMRKSVVKFVTGVEETRVKKLVSSINELLDTEPPLAVLCGRRQLSEWLSEEFPTVPGFNLKSVTLYVKVKKIERDFYTFPHTELENEVERALIKIGRSGVPVLTEMMKNKDAQFREYATILLGKIGFPSSVSVLVKALEDKDEKVREETIQAFGRIGPRAGRLAISSLQVIQNDHNAWIKFLVKEAVDKIRSL